MGLPSSGKGIRRKTTKEIAEGGRRRSRRLQALEELDSEKAVLALPVNPQQTKYRRNLSLSLRKPGRKKKTQISQVIEDRDNGSRNIMNSPLTSRKTTAQIIGYILYKLELRAAPDLFSMPDNLQMCNYKESISGPGLFEKLRQKQTDGMYMTLKQFENDLFTVLQNAINSNSPDSIPFRQAITLREHARQIFLSLEMNLPYTELELSAWHQKNFDINRTSQRTASLETSNNFPLPKFNSDLFPPTRMKRDTGAVNIALHGRQFSEQSQPKSTSSPAGNTGYYLPGIASIQNGNPYSIEGPWRYTSRKPCSNSDGLLFTTFWNDPQPFISNTTTLRYRESLQHFLKDAGPLAKQIVERNFLDCSKRIHAQSIWKPSPFGCQSTIGDHQPLCSSPTPPQYIAGHTTNCSPLSTGTASDPDPSPYDQVEELPTCQLQTDDLLSLCTLIGTPEFLRRSMAINPNQEGQAQRAFRSFLESSGSSLVETNSKREFTSFRPGVAARPSSVSSGRGFSSFLEALIAAQNNGTGQFSHAHPEVPKPPAINQPSIWQPRFGGSKRQKERVG